MDPIKVGVLAAICAGSSMTVMAFREAHDPRAERECCAQLWVGDHLRCENGSHCRFFGSKLRKEPTPADASTAVGQRVARTSLHPFSRQSFSSWGSSLKAALEEFFGQFLSLALAAGILLMSIILAVIALLWRRRAARRDRKPNSGGRHEHRSDVDTGHQDVINQVIGESPAEGDSWARDHDGDGEGNDYGSSGAGGAGEQSEDGAQSDAGSDARETDFDAHNNAGNEQDVEIAGNDAEEGVQDGGLQRGHLRNEPEDMGCTGAALGVVDYDGYACEQDVGSADEGAGHQAQDDEDDRQATGSIEGQDAIGDEHVESSAKHGEGAPVDVRSGGQDATFTDEGRHAVDANAEAGKNDTGIAERDAQGVERDVDHTMGADDVVANQEDGNADALDESGFRDDGVGGQHVEGVRREGSDVADHENAGTGEIAEITTEGFGIADENAKTLHKHAETFSPDGENADRDNSSTARNGRTEDQDVRDGLDAADDGVGMTEQEDEHAGGNDTSTEEIRTSGQDAGYVEEDIKIASDGASLTTQGGGSAHASADNGPVEVSDQDAGHADQGSGPTEHDSGSGDQGASVGETDNRDEPEETSEQGEHKISLSGSSSGGSGEDEEGRGGGEQVNGKSQQNGDTDMQVTGNQRGSLTKPCGKGNGGGDDEASSISADEHTAGGGGEDEAETSGEGVGSRGDGNGIVKQGPAEKQDRETEDVMREDTFGEGSTGDDEKVEHPSAEGQGPADQSTESEADTVEDMASEAIGRDDRVAWDEAAANGGKSDSGSQGTVHEDLAEEGANAQGNTERDATERQDPAVEDTELSDDLEDLDESVYASIAGADISRGHEGVDRDGTDVDDAKRTGDREGVAPGYSIRRELAWEDIDYQAVAPEGPRSEGVECAEAKMEENIEEQASEEQGGGTSDATEHGVAKPDAVQEDAILRHPDADAQDMGAHDIALRDSDCERGEAHAIGKEDGGSQDVGEEAIPESDASERNNNVNTASDLGVHSLFTRDVEGQESDDRGTFGSRGPEHKPVWIDEGGHGGLQEADGAAGEGARDAAQDDYGSKMVEDILAGED